MMYSDPPDYIPEESSSPESYPTFWDAIPVDSPSGAAVDTQAPTLLAPPPADAYAAFLAMSEDGPPSSLHVEQTDVG
jgi:hypothetical protein